MDSSVLKNAIKFDAPPNRGIERKNGLTIVFCNSGKRIEFSAALTEKLGDTEAVEFLFDANCKFLYIKPSANGNILKKNKSRAVIYNAALAEEIKTKYNLDFANHSCLTFDQIEVIIGAKNSVAVRIA